MPADIDNQLVMNDSPASSETGNQLVAHSKSQNRTLPSTAYKPGISGNPAGRPITIRDVLALSREQTAASIATLVMLRDNPKQPGMIRMKCAEALLDRAWGRATNIVQLQDDGGAEYRAHAQALRDMVLASIAGMAGASAMVAHLQDNSGNDDASNARDACDATLLDRPANIALDEHACDTTQAMPASLHNDPAPAQAGLSPGSDIARARDATHGDVIDAMFHDISSDIASREPDK